MTYRANSSDIKTTNKTDLALANKEIDAAIMQEKENLLLRDEPAVTLNQNVYDSLSE